MGVVANLMVRAGADFSELEKKLGGLQKSLKKTGNNLKSIGQTMSIGITAPIVGAGVASIKAASDMQESQSKMAAVLGSMSGEAGKFAVDFSNKFGVSQKALNDHLATLQLVGTNYGLTSDEAFNMSKGMTQITADAAAFNNMGFAEASERLGAALRGEGEAAEALGLSINQTTLAEYARSQGITESITKMSQAELMQLRYGLVMQQTAQMSGYAEKEAAGYAGTMARLQTSVENAMVPIGQALIPLVISLTDKIQKAAEWFTGLDDNTKKIIIVLAGLVAILGPVIMLVGMMSVAIAAISMPMLIMAAGVAVAIAAVVAMHAAFKKLDQFLPQLKANIANTFDNIKNSISNAINSAKTTVGNAINAIKGFFSFKFSWPSLPLPHFAISPSGWKIGDLLKGSIPSLGISWYDKGGIFNSPSVIGVGEKRPEFVGALDDLRYLIRDELTNQETGNSQITNKTQNINIDKFVVQDKGDESRTLSQLQFLSAV